MNIEYKWTKSNEKNLVNTSINTHKHKYKNITTSVLGAQLKSCI